MSAGHPSKAEVFNTAAEMADPAERAAYLDEACADDPDLRKEIEDLLQRDARDESFLNVPPTAIGATFQLPRVAEKPGETIGRYKLLQQIGEGGMGVVYMAEQSEPVQRRVALKIIKPGMETQQVIARFEAERQALAMMDHNNIARVLDAGATESGRPYFVMELVRGVPITQYCDDSRMEPRQRLELFSQVCQAVHHAHQKGIIHRDIKPNNVLVTLHDGEPVPKVIDFGVARATNQRLTERTMFTHFGQVVGTLEYMSPEQTAISGLDVDTRSDVYSLGVLLYELLTGSTPLDRKRLKSAALDEIQRIIRDEEPAKPSTRLSTIESLPTVSAQRSVEPKKLSLFVRGDLDWIVMKSLEKDRSRRYESASSFAADVQRCLSDRPVEASPPSVRYKFRKFAKRNKVALATGTAIAAILLAASVVSIALTAWAIKEQRAAQQERDQKELAWQEAVANEQAAVNASAAAQAVSEFLRRDVLQQANPYHQPQGDLKLGAVLDQAAQNIGDRFVDQPLVEADIRWTIGKSYWGLGRFVEAIDHLEQAVQLRRQTLGRDHPETLRSTRDLAGFLAARGDLQRSETLLTQVLDFSRRRLGEEHEDTLAALRSLARTQLLQGKYDEAQGRYLSVLETQQRTLGEVHAETLRTMNELGWLHHVRGDHSQAGELYEKVRTRGEPILGDGHEVVLMAMDRSSVLHQAAGRYAEAEELRQRVLAIKLRQLGKRHPDPLLTAYELAHLYWEWGKYDRVEELGTELLATYKDVFGGDSSWTSNARVLLAKAHEAKGRHEAAESLLAENVEAVRESTGDESRPTLFAMSLLAGFQRNRGRYNEAEALWTKVVLARARLLGEEHADTLTSRSLLAGLHFLQGEFGKAEKELAEVLAARRRVLGEDHADTLASLENLAEFRRQQQQMDEAEELWTEAVDLRKKRFGEDHPTTLSAQNGLATTYLAQGKYDEAEALAHEALQTRRRVLGTAHPDLAESLAVLGRSFAAQRRFAEAEQQWREALRIREEKTPDDWRRFEALVQLGSVLAAQNKFEQAEPLLIEGYQGLAVREKSVSDKKRSAQALHRIVELYEAWGQPDKGQIWKERLPATEVDPACNSPP